MTSSQSRLTSQLTALVPWRFRSKNNFAMATANWFFTGVRETPPVRVSERADLEVHSLICHRDVNMMLTSAKSFFRHVPGAALVLHDDGSITAEDRVAFQEHLPGARIIERAHADAVMRKLLPSDVFEARARYFFLLKLFDFNHFHEGKKTLLLDSDIVFLSRPDEILAWADTPGAQPFFNEDWCPSYRAKTVPPGLEIPKKLNAGFMGFDGRFTMEQIWNCCRSVDYWLEDQTIYALLLAGTGASPLDPKKYVVYTGGEIGAAAAMVHFISPDRFTAFRYPRLARGLYRSLRQRPLG